MKNPLVIALVFTGLMIFIGQGRSQVPSRQSQQQEELRQSLREKMRKDHEMINRLLNDHGFANINRDFHERFKKLLEDFYQGSPEDFFQQQKFDQFFRGLPSDSFDQSADGQWVDAASERILILKLDIPKDSPLDIKIEKGIIHISGKNKRRRTSQQGGEIVEEVQFQKAFPIPSDCVAGSAQFENRADEIKIRLRKRSHPEKVIPKATPSTPGIQPLAPKQGDITL